MPSVSVILPVYNRAAVLQRAIRSVLAQARVDCELIVVDDGSTVDLPAAVPELSAPGVRYHRQANQGVAAARNAGLRLAEGGLIAFLDSDDELLPEALADLSQRLVEDRAADLAHGWAVTVDEAGRSAVWQRPRLQGLAFRALLYANPLPMGTVLARRACLGPDPFDTGSFIEDWDLWLRLSFRHPFTHVHRVVARLRAEPVRRLTSAPSEQAALAVRRMYARLLDDPAARPFLHDKRRLLEANAHVVAGHHYRLFGDDLAAARREFLKAVRLAPAFRPALVGLAEALAGRRVTDSLRGLRSRYLAGRLGELSQAEARRPP
jgi:glycosyltransferase involved in cell wall biosynthesis